MLRTGHSEVLDGLGRNSRPLILTEVGGGIGQGRAQDVPRDDRQEKPARQGESQDETSRTQGDPVGEGVKPATGEYKDDGHGDDRCEGLEPQ